MALELTAVIHLLGVYLGHHIGGQFGLWLTVVFGFPAMILPGALLLDTFYSQSLAAYDLWKKSLLAISLSIFIVPTAHLVATQLFNLPPTQEAGLIVYQLVTSLLTLLAVGRRLLGRRSLTVQLPSWLQQVPAWAWWSLAIGLAILSAHFFIYPYLPEADGYGWGIVIRDTQRLAAIPLSVRRTQFIYIVQDWQGVTGISVYWLFKLYLPLLVFVVAWLSSIVLLETQQISSRAKVLWSLLPFCLPVFVEELLVGRPQSLALVLFIALPLILAQAMANRQLDILLLCVFISAGAFRLHELSFFVFLVSLIVLFATYWPEIKASPKRSALYILTGLALCLAVTWPTAVGEYLRINALQIAQAFGRHTFRFWFISHYANAGDVEVGWPGIQAIAYYLYNLGVLVVPLLFIRWFYRQKMAAKPSKLPVLPYSALFVIFFAIAEILPRFTYYNLPDRAWVFIAISLVAYLQLNVEFFQQLLRPLPKLSWLLLVLATVSVFGGLYVTYGKQGRVSHDELQAVQFISQTPTNAIFISQSTNEPVIAFFGERRLVTLDPVFQSSDLATRYQAVKDYQSQLKDIDAPVLAGDAQLRELLSKQAALPHHDLTQTENGLSDVTSSFERQLQTVRTQAELNQLSLANAPIYILYSTDKLKGLYARRDWWLKENYAQFQPNSFKNATWLKVVYQNPAVTIWQVTN